MRLTARQKLALKLRLRYKFRREYFTVVLPVVVAAIVVLAAFAVGYASFSQTKPPTQNTGSSEYQQLLNQLNGSDVVDNITLLPIQSNGTLTVQNGNQGEYKLELVFVVGAVISLAPYSLDVSLSERRVKKQEEDFSNFLFELAELIRGGIDPSRAVTTLATGDLGSITKNVRVAAKQLQIGYTFEQAMRYLGDSFSSKLIKRYTDLVIQASYSGGSVSSLIQQASNDLKAFLSLDAERRAGLGQYTVILYFSQVILIAISVIMVDQFLPGLTGLSNYGSAGLAGIFGKSDLATTAVDMDLFYLIVVNGILGGLVIGKISGGSIKGGIKHSLALLVICFIAWNLFVIAPSSTPQVQIAVVSGDATGLAGLPLQHPLIFKVTDLHGNPLKGEIVTLTVSGDGKAVPSSAVTGPDGQAQVSIVLGTEAGVYTIQISDGQAQAQTRVAALAG